MTKLRLRAESQEDLQVISAALQDAIIRVGEIDYSFKSRSLTIRMTRFRREENGAERVLAGLRIDGVTRLRSKGLSREDPEGLAVILSVEYAESDQPPGGNLSLVLAGGGELLAEVECLDVTMADVSSPRITDKMPLHPVDG